VCFCWLCVDLYVLCLLGVWDCDLCVAVLERLCVVLGGLSYARDERCVDCAWLCLSSMPHGVCHT